MALCHQWTKLTFLMHLSCCWQIQNISLMALGKLNKQKSSDLYHNSSLRPPSSAWTFQLFQSQNFSIERFSPEPLSSLCVRTIVLSRHLDMKHSVISGHNLSEFEWKKDMINPVFPAPPTMPCFTELFKSHKAAQSSNEGGMTLRITQQICHGPHRAGRNGDQWQDTPGAQASDQLLTTGHSALTLKSGGHT